VSGAESDRPRDWRGVVDTADGGARLDAWLAARLEGLSRMRVKGLIEAGRVLVGGGLAMVATAVIGRLVGAVGL